MSEEEKAKGEGEQIKGKVREGIGKMTGDEEQQLKGKAEQHGGEVKKKVGEEESKS